MQDLIWAIPGLLVAITVHEYAHGRMAYQLGDPTAAHAGRLTLNPLSHLDPLGALVFWIFRFGWAKPVPVNPVYFADPRRGILLVSAAGPAANFITAFALVLVMTALPLGMLGDAVGRILLLGVWYNIFLGLFNLIPIPPLDGSKILESLLPSSFGPVMVQLNAYGWIILILLIYLGAFGRVLMPLANGMFSSMVTVARLLMGGF